MRNVVIDIDGCLSDYGTPFWEQLRLTGAEMKPFPAPSRPHCWNWYGPYGASDAQSAQALARVRGDGFWWGDQPLDPDWQGMSQIERSELMGEVCRRNTVTFVTQRPDCARAPTHHWLRRHFGIDASVPVLTVPKGKTGVFADLDVQIVVEDRLSTLVAWGPHGKQRGYLVDRPWNREERPQEGSNLVVYATTPQALEALCRS